MRHPVLPAARNLRSLTVFQAMSIIFLPGSLGDFMFGISLNVVRGSVAVSETRNE
jgi:hypothetical protein